jgi:cysteine desulfurase
MIYLDNNATTPPADTVLKVMDRAHRQWWANPSSVHRAGQAVRQQIELARDELAKLIGAKPREIIFTSGATEACNLALRGIIALRKGRRTILTTALEHAAVREPAEKLADEGFEVVHLPATADGVVRAEALEGLLADRAEDVAVVSVHWANNETGVIQPIEAIAELCQAHRIPLHTDATQAVGKLPVDLGALPGISALSLSAHKFHGPKGVGALFARSTLRLAPQVIGGPHERRRRGGTENVPGILGMGEAARLAGPFIAGDGTRKIAALRDQLEQGISHAVPDAVVNAAGAPRLSNTTNIAFPHLEAEAIVILLSERGVYCSAGAACSSGSLEPSPVLLAMGIPEPIAHGSIRLSLSRYTTAEEIDEAVTIITQAIAKLRQSMTTA